MRKQCECTCHPTNHQCLQLSLTPLDYANSQCSMENEYWQNACKCPNCISYEPQTASVDRSKLFDFDAIQVMENEELQQLPEAVNREIVKNSEEIDIEEEEEEEEKVSERNLIKLNDVRRKLLNYNQEIFIEGRKDDVLMQRPVGERMINKENKGDDQKSLEEEKEDATMQKSLIRLNKNNDKILKDQKISFKKEKRDFSKRYMMRLKEEEANIPVNNQEILHEDTKNNFSKRNIIWLNEKDNLKNRQEVTFKQEEEVIERKSVKLDEGNDDTMKNYRIYEEVAFINVKEKNPKDRHLIRPSLYKPKKEYKTRSNDFAKNDYEICLEKRQKLHNKKGQLIMLVNRDQKNIFTKIERNSRRRSLSDDSLIINNKRFFNKSIRNKNKLILSTSQDNKNTKSDPFSMEKHASLNKYHRSFTDYFVTTNGTRSKENALGNVKNVRILEKGEKFLQQIPKYFVASLDHLNSNSIFDQQLNYDSLRWENDDSHCPMKQHDNIRIENEKTLKKSSCYRPAKITIQSKSHSNDIRSPVYDLSPESGFYERNSENNYKELFTRNPKENIKSHSIEAIVNINNSIINDEIADSHFDPSFTNSSDNGNNLVKFADASISKEQIICIENGEQNVDEAKEKYRYPNTSSRRLISNFEKLKKPSIIEKRPICSKDCIQDIDEQLTTQKSGFLNVDTSYKHFRWFDDTIIVEKQIDHNITRNNERKSEDCLNSSISCENIVNDIVVPDYLKQYNDSALTEEQIYSNNEIEERKRIYNSSNNNTSYKNFVSDIVNLDSRQCNDVFIPEVQFYESKIDDIDMTIIQNNRDCFV